MAKVHIHVGAHRTGSSAFQMFLDINAAALRAQGFDLAYPDRDGAEGGRLKLFLPAPRHTPDTVDWRVKKARHNLARQVSDPSRALILSEENILGRMDPFYHGQFYPFLRARARFMARVLDGRPVGRILLVVRPYDSLFLSAFRKRSEDNEMGDFNGIRDRMELFEGDGWPEVALTLIEELQPRKLVVIPYQRPRRELDLARALVPALDPASLREPELPVNASLSDAGLFELQRRYRDAVAPDRAMIEQVRVQYAGVKADRPYAGFTEAQTEKLRVRYHQDLDTLRLMMGLEVIEPPQQRPAPA
ncbi:hypothetical protein [Aliiroseovarius sp.]|uniref:hypothetical protein n=1 Tax=Aliiroseovarius sp. TaxID=1872442 RepID=UPI002613027B|nr:hypothetical protein [Aliiroseovarius sp.]